MLKALEFLHSEAVNIIHRDIKPHNILFNNMHHFYLADFGHARQGLPWPRGHSGSFEYMAPEMYHAEPQTAAADIWSLGIVCMDMMGFLPYTCPTHDFRSMKRRQWCEAMVEFAENINKPEVEAMVRIEAHTRPSASELLKFLDLSSTVLVGGVQVPPEFFQQVMRMSLPRGTVDEDRPRPLTGKRADSLIGMADLKYSTHDPELIEPQPSLGPPQARHSSLTYPSTFLRSSIIRRAKVARPAQGTTSSSRSAGGVTGPSSSASASSPMTQGTGDSQSAIATPPPTGSQATGGPTRTAAIPRPAQSQDSSRPPSAAATRTQSQESTQPPSAAATQNPTQRSRTIGTQTRQQVKEKYTQTTNAKTKAVETQTKNPTTNDTETQTTTPTTNDAWTQTKPKRKAVKTQTTNDAETQKVNPKTTTAETQTLPTSLRTVPAQQTPASQAIARSSTAEPSLTATRSNLEPSDQNEADQTLARTVQSTSSTTWNVTVPRQNQTVDNHGRGRSSRQLSSSAPPWDPSREGRQPIPQRTGERPHSSDRKASAQPASPPQTPHAQSTAERVAPRPRPQPSSPQITSQQNRAVTAPGRQLRQYQPLPHLLQRSPAQQNPIHPAQWSPGYSQPAPMSAQPVPLYPHLVLSPTPAPPILSPQGPLFPVVVFSPVPQGLGLPQ